MVKTEIRPDVQQGGEHLQVVTPVKPQKERGRVFDIFGGSRRRQRRVEQRLAEAKVAELKARKEALKAVGDERWRLVDIEVTHTDGSTEQAKGWDSVINANGKTDNKSETINSLKTPFKTFVVLMDPKMLGTHEDTDEDNLKTIDFSKGWNGPAIAGIVVPDGKGGIYEKMLNAVTDANDVTLAILGDVGYGKIGIADGHHRQKVASEGQQDGYKTAISKAIRQAIKQGLQYVPVQIIPFGTDPSVVLDTWHSDGKVWTPEQVYECFQDSAKMADAKRTKFGVTGTDGVTRRILSALPNVKVPLENLLPAA